uniref:F-box domain-containing protein n=1 Tax=Panagrellus redivivus TaxID=6233 RepID=A0A7E4UQX5_PANRE
MPYPILTLPYPFAKRLCQLLSPSEVQELQIAAGHNVIDPLKPFVSSIQNYGLSLYGIATTDPHAINTCQAYLSSPGNVFSSTNLTNIRRDSVRYSVEVLLLLNMSNTALKNLNLRSQQIKTYLIDINSSHVTNDLLKNVARTTVGCEYLTVYDNRFDENVTFDTIVDNFPRLNTLILNYAYCGWLSDLTNARKNLNLILRFDSFETVFSFRPEELYDFIAKQGPKFCIYLSLESNDPAAIYKVMAYIDPRFQRGYSEKNGCNFALQDLQIAAGVNLINPLKPIVSSHKDFGVCFQGNPNDTTKCELFRNSNPYSYDVINIRESEQYLMKCKSVRLHEMSNTALERVNQNSLLIKTYEFEIEESRISNVFLNNLSKITVGSSRFGVHNSYFDEDVTFLTMLDCFPHLSSIVLNNAYFGWLNDLSGLEKRLQFIFMHDYFEKIFNFRPEELYDFVAVNPIGVRV